MRPPRLFVAVAVATLAGACDPSPPHAREPAAAGGDTVAGGDARESALETAPSPPLIDPTIPPAVAGEGGWNYHQSASADLDGHGRAERVVLTARVEMYRGRPAWDDGQPWQVYVETAEGARTYLYAQRLQLGTLTMRITSGSDGARRTIVLLEHLPDRLSVYEALYAAPDSATVVTRFRRELDPVGDTASPRLP